jgi:hypothetical protein
MSVTLPTIGGNYGGEQQHGGMAFFDEQKSMGNYEFMSIAEEEEYDENKFSDTAKKLTVQSFPVLDENGTMKNRIFALEHTADTQADVNKLSHRTFMNLSADLRSTEDHLKELLGQVQNGFELKLIAMKKEYDHRSEGSCVHYHAIIFT